MTTPIVLTTEHLLIKAPQAEDYADLYVLQSNPEVMTFIGNGIRSPAEVLSGLNKAIDHQAKHGFSLGSVFQKETMSFIGRAGLIYKNYDDQQNEVELGYALLPQYWRQGYATELAIHLIDWAHTTLHLSTLVAVIHPENLGSKKVVQQAGMNFWKEELYNNNSSEVWYHPF